MVFTTPIGTAIDPDNLRCHDLRHTMATLMRRDDRPVHEVSAVLGHSRTSTTLNVDSNVLPGANESAVAAIECLLG